ncbi:nucleotidyltransferase domain-containing protein [bacterium]|nr:nucleotidyltransferase domain-containing protein [bacterium]
MIREHHKREIERLVDKFSPDERYRALIIGGSVAKGMAKDNSDVDILLVATDEEFEQRKEKDDIFYLDMECGYDGGYIDGKVINLQFIKDAADHGSEPARWAFTGAFAAYSHIPGLDDLIKQIPVYQESDHAEKIKTFYTMVCVMPWFAREAKNRKDPYLATKSATDTVLFAARLALAHNKLLYPYHKWLMTQLHKAADKPEELISLMDTALTHPSQENTEAIRSSITNYYGDHGLDWSAMTSRFLKECEWNWLEHRPPVYDW